MKHLLPALATVAIMAATSTFAEERGLVDAFHCTNVSNDIARLQCFDKAYGDFRAAAEAPGDWFVETSTNPLNDVVTILVALNASGDAHPLYGRSQLIIACRGTELLVAIAWNSLLLNDNYRVSSRIGSSQAETKPWSKPTSGRITIYPGEPVNFVKKLMGVNRFVAQLAPGTEEKNTAIFNVVGLREAAKPIEDACLSEAASFEDFTIEMLE